MNPAISIIDGTIRRLEQGWTKRDYARNARNLPVSFYDPSACRWCLVGALMAAQGEEGDNCTGAWEALESAVGTPSLSYWNDHQESVEPVLVACREARRILATQDAS